MKKEEIIQRLEATLIMLHSLKAGEFNYKHYIAKDNPEHTCGTTCCLAGWYPRYFPESGLIWEKGVSSVVLTFEYGVSRRGLGVDVEQVLADYHGFSAPLTRAIFYGAGLDDIISPVDCLAVDSRSIQGRSKTAIIKRLEHILALIQLGTLDRHLDLS